MVGDRIKKLIERNGITPYELSQKTGVSQATISRLISGKTSKPSIDNLDRIADYLHTTRRWLLTGEGDMIASANLPMTKDEKLKLAREVLEEQESGNISTGKVIPYYDVEAAAGTSYEVDMTGASRPIGMIEIGGLLKDSESALRVYGNSMTPNYPPGCVIGLRRHYDRFIEPGCVYVVETRNNRYLKRLYNNDSKDGFSCISDNHMVEESGPRKGQLCYPEFEIPLEDVKSIFQVTGVIKRNII